jgi:phenylacetate-coenzyme A ligase PaaK-like adenylate-forming protein
MLETLWAAAGKLAELRRYDRMSRAEIDAAKLEKFRRLVASAVARAPYYADIVKERGIDVAACTPADFPVLTKSILMANFDRIVTDRAVTRQAVSDFLSRSRDPAEKFLGKYRVIHTSGTSGEVGYFLYSSTDWVRGLLVTRRSRDGERRKGGGKVRVAFYGATDGHYAGVTMATSLGRGPMSLSVEVRTFEINRPLDETIAALNAFQPEMLTGYTNALKVLAEKRRAGVLTIAPFAITAAGETVTQTDAQVIRDAFGVAPVSGYGSSEHLLMGASNPDGETMTLFDDDLIYEFADDHCLVTNLFNFTEPLIRYRMSDILKPVAHDGPPGGPAPRRLVISTLVGRTELTPTFTTRDGTMDFISPHTINEIFVAGVTRFQLRLTGERSFRFLATLQSGLDTEARAAAVAGLEARLREILAAKKLDDVAFMVEVVDEIPPDPKSRKFKLIVDERTAAREAAPADT